MLTLQFMKSLHGRILVLLQKLRSRKQLSALEAHQLRDIGLTQVQAARESKKPFWRA